MLLVAKLSLFMDSVLSSMGSYGVLSTLAGTSRSENACLMGTREDGNFAPMAR